MLARNRTLWIFSNLGWQVRHPQPALEITSENSVGYRDRSAGSQSPDEILAWLRDCAPHLARERGHRFGVVRHHRTPFSAGRYLPDQALAVTNPHRGDSVLAPKLDL